ncbi:PucR family transcriptional regulator [Microbacterium sp. RD1]|uniref:PucR family transcriptional regulator n=1 Tax=Microbacterium sp. RD1 TaxID=3457313 RepID=UPI003FA5CBD1
MTESIHEVIERTAHRLRRSVAVDDPGLRLLASSAHFEDVDQARLSSLVGRKITGPLRDYVMAQGAQSWRETTVLPARPELGVQWDRLCFPLRSRFELLGFMWIMTPVPLDEEELQIARQCAGHVREVLMRRAQSLADADIEAESLVRALLSADASAQRRAAQDMRDLGMFAGCTDFVGIVVATDPGIRSGFGEPSEDVVRRAVATAAEGRAYALAAGGSESAVILGSPGLAHPGVAQPFARALHREIRRWDAGLAAAAVVGVGAAQSPLESAARSCDQARIAAQIGRARGEHVVTWSEHPVDELLTAMLDPRVDEWLVPEALQQLMASQPAATIELVETFLDHAGNVIATAEALQLHRTTVYYRINRLQERTGLNLEDGSTRLLLHLWLRTRRLVAATNGQTAPRHP